MGIPKASDEDFKKMINDPCMQRKNFLKVIGEGLSVTGCGSVGGILASTKVLVSILGVTVTTAASPVVIVAGVAAGAAAGLSLCKVIEWGTKDECVKNRIMQEKD